MKRIVLFTFTMLLCIFCYAQSEHLKFSGIPIDGTINQFQAKIVQRGYVYNKLYSEAISNGVRCFDGTFVGNKVGLYVYYDEQIKKVYRVKAVINNISEELADQKYQMIQQLLQRKYEDCYFQEDKKENKPSLTIYASRYELPSEEEPIWKECFGRIDIFISQNETIYNYPYIYNVHIDYWDQINTDKHENKLLDEL